MLEFSRKKKVVRQHCPTTFFFLENSNIDDFKPHSIDADRREPAQLALIDRLPFEDRDRLVAAHNMASVKRALLPQTRQRGTCGSRSVKIAPPVLGGYPLPSLRSSLPQKSSQAK